MIPDSVYPTIIRKTFHPQEKSYIVALYSSARNIPSTIMSLPFSPRFLNVKSNILQYGDHFPPLSI